MAAPRRRQIEPPPVPVLAPAPTGVRAPVRLALLLLDGARRRASEKHMTVIAAATEMRSEMCSTFGPETAACKAAGLAVAAAKTEATTINSDTTKGT